ncbi:MAG: hypothetical protein OHK006_09510 [Thermodesulfovibrionales bacterium]
MSRAGFQRSRAKTSQPAPVLDAGWGEHAVRSAGVTLVELVVVIAIIGILVIALGGAMLSGFSSESRMRTAARELVADLQLAQNDAASFGGGTVINGELRRQSIFVVFDPANRAYSIWRYQDTDGDNVRDAGESALSPTFPVSKVMPNDAAYGLTYKATNGTTATVDKTACGNGAGTPSGAISFGAQAAPPCNGNNCFEMNSKGFPSFTGSIYLSNGIDAFAVNINAAGLIRMCRWAAEEGQWVDAY